MISAREHGSRPIWVGLLLFAGLVIGPLPVMRPHRAQAPSRRPAVAAAQPRARMNATQAPRTGAHAAARGGDVSSASVPAVSADVFRGLGAWADLYDYGLDPRATTRRMAAAGVQTLYLQTGRANTARGIDPRAGRWLRAAHASGIRVVGWYLPYYSDVRRDAARTAAIARARLDGERFDGLAVDIEYRGAVGSLSSWNRRVAAQLSLVRRAVGPAYPIGAITPTPLQMEIAKRHWSGFPWAAVARYGDAVLLMSYWSDRADCAQIVLHCAYEFTKGNVELARLATGRGDLIVHIIGGVGGSITTDELSDFVRAARDARADGASIYDIATTKMSWWKHLRALRALG